MNKDNIWVGLGIGVMILCIVVCVIWLDAFFGVIVGGILGLIGMVAVAVVRLVLESAADDHAERKAFKEEHPHYDAEQFYMACLKEGIKDAVKEKDKKRIAACARSQGLHRSEESAVAFYLLGKSEIERLREKAKREEMERLLKQEAGYEKHTTRFAGLSPHEKMRATCQENAEEARQKYNYLSEHQNDGFDSAERLYNLSKQKEYDWATMGGIASGLAGGAAGIAVAADAQIKNAQIRQQNADLRNATYTMAAMAWTANLGKLTDARKSMERWEKRVENAHTLPVKKMPAEKLMEIISPEVVEKKQSESGAILLKVKIPSHADKCPDIGGEKGIVDGTFKAVFWKGETRVAEALLMLPSDNSPWRDYTVEGICRSDALKERQNYRITFEPDKLWMTGSVYTLPDE